MDVSVVTLGLDWHARKEVQPELAGMARTLNTSTTTGLLQMLRQAASLLLRHESSWVYSGALDHSSGRPAAEAEERFRKATAEVASRYREETIRNLRGVRDERTARGPAPSAEEGPGFLLVTLAVHARRELPDVRNVRDAFCLRNALEAFGKLTESELAAVEVIRSPSEETDCLSSAELETLYAGLRKRDDDAEAGRVFCVSCGKPFAAELRSCPSCGTPA